MNTRFAVDQLTAQSHNSAVFRHLEGCECNGQNCLTVAVQVAVAPAAGCARTSAVHGLPKRLVAGAPATLRIVLADEHGNPAAGGGDAVAVSVDSALEGAVAVPVEVGLRGPWVLVCRARLPCGP